MITCNVNCRGLWSDVDPADDAYVDSLVVGCFYLNIVRENGETILDDFFVLTRENGVSVMGLDVAISDEIFKALGWAGEREHDYWEDDWYNSGFGNFCTVGQDNTCLINEEDRTVRGMPTKVRLYVDVEFDPAISPQIGRLMQRLGGNLESAIDDGLINVGLIGPDAGDEIIQYYADVVDISHHEKLGV